MSWGPLSDMTTSTTLTAISTASGFATGVLPAMLRMAVTGSGAAPASFVCTRGCAGLRPGFGWRVAPAFRGIPWASYRNLAENPPIGEQSCEPDFSRAKPP